MALVLAQWLPVGWTLNVGRLTICSGQIVSWMGDGYMFDVTTSCVAL